MLWEYVSIEDALNLHEKVIGDYGGSFGLRDRGLLDAALAAPRQTMFGEELYPDIYSKASILLFSLVKNHVFVDGNKRTGTVVMARFLYVNNYQLTADKHSLYQFVIQVATSELDKEAIADWLRLNTTPIR